MLGIPGHVGGVGFERSDSINPNAREVETNRSIVRTRPSLRSSPRAPGSGNFDNSSARYFVESRSHFGAWCITSSPLILGLDVTDKIKVDGVWSIISNKEAIAVNQAWFGHPGRLVRESQDSYQIWAKRVAPMSEAVVVLNLESGPLDVTFTLGELGLSGNVSSRDVWSGTEGPTVGQDGVVKVSQLASHDSVFYVLSGV